MQPGLLLLILLDVGWLDSFSLSLPNLRNISSTGLFFMILFSIKLFRKFMSLDLVTSSLILPGRLFALTASELLMWIKIIIKSICFILYSLLITLRRFSWLLAFIWKHNREAWSRVVAWEVRGWEWKGDSPVDGNI